MDRLKEKEEQLKKIYEGKQRIKSELPVKEYAGLLLLKKEYNLPFTKDQAEFLNIISPSSAV